jgi:hypothetical protein
MDGDEIARIPITVSLRAVSALGVLGDCGGSNVSRSSVGVAAEAVGESITPPRARTEAPGPSVPVVSLAPLALRAARA